MIPLIIYDVIAVNAAYVAALWLRFDCRFTMIPREYLMRWLHFAPIYTVFCVVLLLLFRLYHSLWQYASYTELYHLLASCAITAVFHLVGCLLLVGRMPISYWILGAVRMQMQKERRITDYNNAWERVQQTDYAGALAILRELVDLIDDDGRY